MVTAKIRRKTKGMILLANREDTSVVVVDPMI